MHRIRITPNNSNKGDQRDYSLYSGSQYPDAGKSSDNKVKNTMTALPRDEANVEVEGGESVVADINNDGFVEHTAFKGKRHSEGGMPVNLPEGSFIYSDTKKLKIKDKSILKDYFGLSNKAGGYTPAEIAKKYQLNNYLQTIKDPNSDPIAVRTASKMLQDNMQKLGMVALLQESMKGFPDGVPAIAQSVMAGLQGGGQGQEGAQPQQGVPEQGESQEQYADQEPDIDTANTEQAIGQFKDGGLKEYSGLRRYKDNTTPVNNITINSGTVFSFLGKNYKIKEIRNVYGQEPVVEFDTPLVLPASPNEFKSSIVKTMPISTFKELVNARDEKLNFYLKNVNVSTVSRPSVTRSPLSEDTPGAPNIDFAGEYVGFHSSPTSQTEDEYGYTPGGARYKKGVYPTTSPVQQSVPQPTPQPQQQRQVAPQRTAPVAPEAPLTLGGIPVEIVHNSTFEEGGALNRYQDGTPATSGTVVPGKKIIKFRYDPETKRTVPVYEGDIEGTYEDLPWLKHVKYMSAATGPNKFKIQFPENATPQEKDEATKGIYAAGIPIHTLLQPKNLTIAKETGAPSKYGEYTTGFTPQDYEDKIVRVNKGDAFMQGKSAEDIRREAFKIIGLNTSEDNIKNPEKAYNDPAFKEKFTEAFYKYLPEGTYRPDMKNDKLFGIEHYKAITAKPTTPAPVVDGKPVVTPVDNTQQKGLDPAPVRKSGPWWIQDQMNFAASLMNKHNVYDPMLQQVDLEKPGYVLNDPTRMLAANQEQQARIQNQVQNSTSGNVAAATIMGSSGDAFANASNVLAGVENQNVRIVNNAYANNASITNNEIQANANLRDKYLREMATTNQQDDNQTRNEMTGRVNMFNTGMTNWQHKNAQEQGLTKQAYVDPVTGIPDFSGVGKDTLNPYNQTNSGNTNSGSELLKRQGEYYNSAYDSEGFKNLPEAQKHEQAKAYTAYMMKKNHDIDYQNSQQSVATYPGSTGVQTPTYRGGGQLPYYGSFYDAFGY